MVCQRAQPLDEPQAAQGGAPPAPLTPELQPEFEGEDVNRQLERFSRFTMSRTRGPAEASRILQVCERGCEVVVVEFVRVWQVCKN